MMKTGNIEPQQWWAALAGRPKSETQSPPAAGADDLEWWTRLTAGERAVIRAVVRMLRSARRSRARDVAWAAAKWERGLGCFIKVRLICENQRAELRRQRWPQPPVDRGWVRVPGKQLPGPEANG